MLPSIFPQKRRVSLLIDHSETNDTNKEKRIVVRDGNRNYDRKVDCTNAV